MSTVKSEQSKISAQSKNPITSVTATSLPLEGERPSEGEIGGGGEIVKFRDTKTAEAGELLHVDLYRLPPPEALSLLESSADHPGLRCVEWADRVPSHLFEGGIVLTLKDEPGRSGRSLTVEFLDLPIPSRDDVIAWREEILLSPLIAKHCDAVAAFSVRLGEELLKRGIVVRLAALRAAGELHDLLRFTDFRGAAHIEEEVHPERAKTWEALKARYRGMRHEAAATTFLREHGFPEIAEIVRVHGLTLTGSHRITTEQRVLYYADKRVKIDEVVSLEERLSDFTERYSKNGKLEESDAWYEEARRTERELFPEGPPF
jgi:HD superfamily phosphohydrolase YqeK